MGSQPVHSLGPRSLRDQFAIPSSPADCRVLGQKMDGHKTDPARISVQCVGQGGSFEPAVGRPTENGDARDVQPEVVMKDGSPFDQFPGPAWIGRGEHDDLVRARHDGPGQGKTVTAWYRRWRRQRSRLDEDVVVLAGRLI